jgi:hypothetical protein
MIRWLSPVYWWRSCAALQVRAALPLSPTADYHRTLEYRLVTEGFDAVLVSSVAGARLREAIFNAQAKVRH